MQFPLPTLGAAIVALSSVSHAAYVENFPNTGMGNISHGNVAIGWEAYYGSTATNGSGNTGNGGNGGFVVSNLSSGYGAKTATTPGTYGLTYSTELATLNVTTADITDFSFLARNSSASDRFRVVIGVDVSGITHWYASNSFFTTADGIWSGPESKNLPFNAAGANWRALTFIAGSELSLSDSTLPSAVPNGMLVAAGLFVSGNNNTAGTSGGANANTMRYDNFTVNFVPEPSSALLSLLGATAMFTRRRR